MPPLQSGTRLGPYEMQNPLGASGMGDVYRARDMRLGIKILPQQLLNDPMNKQRFGKVVSSR